MISNKSECAPNSETLFPVRFAFLKLLVVSGLFIAVTVLLGYSLSAANKRVGAIPVSETDLRATSGALASTVEPPQSGSTQVSIYFDEVAPFTDVSARYPYIRFSSPGLVIYPYPGGAYTKSPPNALTRGIGYANVYNRHFADLIIDFTQPVNNLKFYVTEGDSFGTIAYYDYYQNGNLSQANIPIGGPGFSHTPIAIDFQTANIGNVTKVKVHDITDAAGLSFDDFTFSVPAPTPTPTPTPTPPAAPTLKGVPDETSAKLDWSPSAGASSYIITRSGDCLDDLTSASTWKAVNVENNETASSAIVVPGNSTSFVDQHLCADHTYTYTVAAAGADGLVSSNSNSVSVTPIANACWHLSSFPRPNNGGKIHVNRNGWSMDYSVSDRDGLVLYDIYLNGRRMAARFSVPYFQLETYTDGSGPFISRGELRPNDGNTTVSLRSRLIGFPEVASVSSNFLTIKAVYAIDRIPGAPRACLNITQEYQFFPVGFSYPSEWPGPCEPSEEAVDCAKFRPMVKYNFQSPDSKEHLIFISIPQRQHYEVSAQTVRKELNTVGLFQDEDSLYEAIGNGTGFVQTRNPLEYEGAVRALVRGVAGDWDNFHETWKSKIKEPSLTVGGEPTSPRTWYFIGAGCLECVHMHWRWAKYFAYEPFGAGYPLLPPRPGMGNYQSLDIAVVRQHDGEEHPNEFGDLVQREILSANRVHPREVVLWYSPTGYVSNGIFFWHTAWFNGRDPAQSGGNIPISLTQIPDESADGPYSVNLGDVFKEGNNHIELYDLNSLGPLPPGYAALNGAAYKITTDALASGPYTVSFRAASITDQVIFQNLRIFQAEPDPFDPERPIWVDKTVLAPDSPPPDFSTKTLSSSSEELGVFVIGKLIQAVPPDTSSANLSVSCADSIDPVLADNAVTYIITVSNSGPDVAHEVALRDVLPGQTTYISATPSQGTCKGIDSVLYCALGTISAGANATVTLIVSPMEGALPLPASGKTITNSVAARAKETDPVTDNNSTDQDTLVLPNPNLRPSISINSPTNGSLITGPANLSISAAANDSDGTISVVKFFDNGNLVGTGTLTNPNTYVISEPNVSYGAHTIVAVAIDNAGRTGTSIGVNVMVNGAAVVAITNPASGTLVPPASSLTIAASATHPSGAINDVEVFANGQSLGKASAVGNGQYQLNWQDLTAGAYSIVAIATDGSGIKTSSYPVPLTVDTPPTVSLTKPSESAAFPSATNIGLAAIAQSSSGSIAKVDFYANGVLIASANDTGTADFMSTWRNVADGIYALTAVATDNLGVSTTSDPITIGVNTASPHPGEFVWFDDALPPGALTPTDQEGWYWVDANPGAFSGTKSHQSRNFIQAPTSNAIHQHYFVNASMTLPISVGDKLFTYVFLDVNNMPRELMLQWKDLGGWEHRAYWGQNTINLGVDGTSSRYYMGSLPEAGTWVRLEVPASVVGLEGSVLDGMAFTLDGGRASFDLTGKATANATPPAITGSGDFVWIDDPPLPTGAVITSVNETWNWNAIAVYSGQVAHQSGGVDRYSSHSFTGAQTPMAVNPGDVLFAYVYLGDPDTSRSANVPHQIMLEWYDGSTWGHRAYWGENYIGQRVRNTGVQGTESQRYMGGLPRDGRAGGCGIPGHPGWCRLEVPASYVGLEGKNVSGMAFSAYRDSNVPIAFWDRAGKAAEMTTTPLPLSAASGVWRLYGGSNGYSYNTNDQGEPDHIAQAKDVFFVHPNQAAGTVAMHRFRRGSEYFYAICKTCYNDWQYDEIAFYVYPDDTTPGTVPLYLYHNSSTRYFMTTNQSEAIALGMTFDAIWAYVLPALPARPTSLAFSGCDLTWTDNSTNESGFKIERWIKTPKNTTRWSEVARVFTNVTSLTFPCPSKGRYRVSAFNATGSSTYSNEAVGFAKEGEPPDPPPNTPPTVSIVNAADCAAVDSNFAITANAFDVDGNGTIAKVEFFANGVKLGEIANPPYVFAWNSAPAGFYSLTVVATDSSGAASASAPICAVVPADFTSGLVGYWKLDENTGSVAADSSGNNHNGTLQNGPAWTVGRRSAALSFDGADDYVYDSGITDVTNNFTLSFWAYPTGTHEIDGESTSGYAGVSGQRYAFWPAWYDGGQAGVGLSVATNGVSVYEHAANYMPATLVYPATINGWNHITLVYENRLPKLYINGTLVRTGVAGSMGVVHLNPSVFGGQVYGYYAGRLDEIRAYNRALTAGEVSMLPYAGGVTYRASADFSTTQGLNSWYYLDSIGTLMTFNATNNWWNGVEQYSILGTSWGHPGGYTDPVRQWRAPALGSVHITGMAADADPGGGDGVVVSITKNGQVLWQQGIANGNTSGFNYDLTVPVAAGDQISFIINRNGNSMWDTTMFDPTIAFTSP